jgi:hypothetical protein
MPNWQMFRSHCGAVRKYRDMPDVMWHYVRMAILVDLLGMKTFWCKMENWLKARASDK